MENVVPFRRETPRANDDFGFEGWCCEEMPAYEAKWRASGAVFAWFSKEPSWTNGSRCWFWLDDPKEPCRRIFRFSLIGGGQVAVIENFRRYRYKDEVFLSACYETAIVTTAHVHDHVQRYRGTFDGYAGECKADAVIFGFRTPQHIADRTAATLAAIGVEEENFYALLDGSQGCAMCSRPLRDEVSKLVGVGPDCARRNGIPHNMEAASRRLKLCRELLGEHAA